MNDLFSLFTVKILFYFTIAGIIHELGHLLIAKFFKFKVTQFCIGIGPKIYGKKYGDTEYMVRLLLPMGGYINLDIQNADNFSSSTIAKWTAGVWAGPVINLIVGILTIKLSPLFAFINLFTGIINLIPIPSADGWLIMVGTYKFFKKRREENVV